MAREPVTVTVEVVLLSVLGRRLHVLLRGQDGGPRRLPGAEVEPGETLGEAGARALAAADGPAAAHLEQLRTYGDPGRDPRGRVVSTAYLGLVPARAAGAGGGASAAWVPVRDRTVAAPLALDHAAILADGVERARGKLEYTALAAALVDEPFSLADLRHVYEAVWGAPLDPGNFRRKVLSTPGFVEPVDGLAPPGPGGGPPARLYRRGSSRVLSPPMLRRGEPPPEPAGTA